MTDDLTLADLAEQVLDANDHATKREWGEQLHTLIEYHDTPDIRDEVHELLLAALGRRVASVKEARERAAAAERRQALAVSYTGRPLSPTLSVRTESGARQLALWVTATPQQFVEAVQREQRVIDGRHASNAIRMDIAKSLLADERLMALPTLGAVCAELEVDPDTLGLEELAS